MDKIIPIQLERTHLFSADINVSTMVEIDRTIEKENVEEAIDAVLQRHPLLSSVIRRDDDGNAFYHLNCSKPFHIDFHKDAEISWEDWFMQQIEKTFDFENGPLLRLLVLFKEKSTVFVFVGHHLLGDGLSFLYLSRDFLMALERNLAKEVKFPLLLQKSLLPSYAKLRFLPALLAKKLNKDFQSSQKRYSLEEFKILQKSVFRSRQPSLAGFSFTKEETARLIAQCHKAEVTVNEALTTAFLYARKKAGNPSDYLGISCNIRNEIKVDPEDSMGNFVSGISISVQYDKTIDFWENAKRLQNILSPKLKSPRQRLLAMSFLAALNHDLIDSVNFVSVEKTPHKSTKILCDRLCGNPYDRGLGISNLGKHYLAFKTFQITDFLFLPPLFGQNDFIVGAITVNDHLFLCLRYIGSELSRSMVDKQYLDAKEILLSTASKN